nr:16S rRNA (guanine(966)-N(2))-methyltransferase RsmD [uncultured Acetatifactor sp.]
MRVIAGTARSLPLKAPEGRKTRPTTDRIKETLFNMIQTHIPGCVFVDVFSGSGGIGIEAISRGARKAYFIDNHSAAVSCIQENLAFTKLQDRAIVIKQDFLSALGNIREKEADIVFLDPPYGAGYEKQALALLSSLTYITGNTVIIIEAALHEDFSWAKEYGFVLEREKKYKTNKHVFFTVRIPDGGCTGRGIGGA